MISIRYRSSGPRVRQTASSNGIVTAPLEPAPLEPALTEEETARGYRRGRENDAQLARQGHRPSLCRHRAKTRALPAARPACLPGSEPPSIDQSSAAQRSVRNARKELQTTEEQSWNNPVAECRL